jgi:mannose-1-phosphate guanylyltransferase / mannose-6-phosphate isomerase
MLLIQPLILCGGAGARLWPLSRESMPKQFVPLIGTLSTFQQTLQRVSDRNIFDVPIIVTNEEFRFIVEEQARAVSIEVRILLEPARRDSAPAIAAAAALVAQIKENMAVLVLASDHLVREPKNFVTACQDAMPAVAAGRIVTFGIKPTGPATSYGYILPGQIIADSAACEAVDFVEKPNLETAERYVADGYLWNSGNLMFRPTVMLGELARFERLMHDVVLQSVNGIKTDLNFMRLAAEPYSQAPRKSIDYAVMEHSELSAVMPLDCGWSDIGSWDALWQVQKTDIDSNVTSGMVEVLDTQSSLIYSDTDLMTSVVGCRDIVVVATRDSVLVIPRAQSERVKGLVEQLKHRNRRQALEHTRVHRPWGYYQSVDVGGRHQVKRISVTPGGRLSLQKHHHRSEHWIVVKGTAEVTVGERIQIVHENESAYIPIGSIHRLANPGKIPLELIEVQVGSYLEEDDIVRIEDVYQRQ